MVIKLSIFILFLCPLQAIAGEDFTLPEKNTYPERYYDQFSSKIYPEKNILRENMSPKSKMRAGTTYIAITANLTSAFIGQIIDRYKDNEDVILILKGPDKNDKVITDVFKRIIGTKSLNNNIANIQIFGGIFEKFNITKAPSMIKKRKNIFFVAVGVSDNTWFNKKIDEYLKKNTNPKIGGVVNFNVDSGKSTKVSEISLREFLQQKMAKVDWDAQKENAVKNFWKKLDGEHLKAASADRERVVDLTVYIQKDVYHPTNKSKIIYHKGQAIKPNYSIPFNRAIIVFNPNLPKQIVFAEKQRDKYEKEGLKTILILDQLPKKNKKEFIFELMTKFNQKIYLLKKMLKNAYELEFTPSVITEENKKTYVREYDVED